MSLSLIDLNSLCVWKWCTTPRQHPLCVAFLCLADKLLYSRYLLRSVLLHTKPHYCFSSQTLKVHTFQCLLWNDNFPLCQCPCVVFELYFRSLDYPSPSALNTITLFSLKEFLQHIWPINLRVSLVTRRK